MPSPILAAVDSAEAPKNLRQRPVLAWLSTTVFLLIFALACSALAKYVEISQKLLDGLEVNPLQLTRFVVTNHRWLLPLLFFSTAVIATSKLIIPLDEKRKMILNLILIGVAILGPAFVIFSMYLPVLELAWKLQSAK